MKKWCSESNINKLSDDAKTRLIIDLASHDLKVTQENNELREKLRLKSVEPYLPSSEQTPYLFNEMEEISLMGLEAESNDTDTKENTPKKKASHKVKRLPANTPITVIDHSKDAKDLIKDANGYIYKRVADKTVDKIGFIPAKYYIERHVYACYQLKDFEPEKGDIKTIVLWNNKKTDVLSASSSLVAKTIVKKYSDSLPLYRQEQIFKRDGLDISRQTLSNWLLTYAELLEPLQKRFKKYLFESPLINQDETPVQVLHLDKENPTKTRFMLVRVGTSYQNPEQDRIIVQFSFIKDRKIDTLSQDTYLYDGYWMTDGLKGYNHLEKHLNCWVHAERRLKKYLKINSKNKDARKIVFTVGKLFTIEKDLRAKLSKNIITRNEFMSSRQLKTKKVFNELLTYLNSIKDNYTPKSEMGIAIKYFYTYWDSLIRYPECFESNPSNNIAENAIRPFCVGRKNWLFSVSEAGAEASAMYYSLIETAKANKINPYKYLWYILSNAPKCKSNDDWDQLMPWNVKEETLNSLQVISDRAKVDFQRTEDYIIRGSH